MNNVSMHLTEQEVACRGTNCCDNTCFPDDMLLAIFEEIRRRVDRPIIVSSWCRCRRHNATIPGAAKRSLHTMGKAADLMCPKGMTVDEFAETADAVLCGTGGLILYHNRIHIDVRSGATFRQDKR